MNESARYANQRNYEHSIGLKLARIIELLERLVLANLEELSPEPPLSPDGENEEESET